MSTKGSAHFTSSFMRSNMEGRDHMRAIAGQGYVDCTYELRGAKLLGATAEHKTEHVFVLDWDHPEDKERLAREAISPIEIDGWRGRWQDAVNPHKWRDEKHPGETRAGHWCQVAFFRHVRDDGSPIVDLDPDQVLTRQGFIDNLVQVSRRACRDTGTEYGEEVATRIADLCWAIYGRPGPHVFAQKRDDE